MSPIEVVKLGDKAYDVISGVEGIVIGEIKYLYSADELMIQPQSKDNIIMEPICLPVSRVRQLWGDKVLFGDKE